MLNYTCKCKYNSAIKNKKYKIDNDNGSIVVAGVKKFELKLGNYGGSFEIPTLLQIPSFSQNGNSNILVSGNNTVNGNQSGSLSESGDVILMVVHHLVIIHDHYQKVVVLLIVNMIMMIKKLYQYLLVQKLVIMVC
ncbi:hypothetical protein [Spiroplasma endosymbiont of Nomada ruficornis]|uniref:hypothetical protein n=1 Tax=Spiroplasma endosymbiont of Nomada ruficornis TaxID=3066325 RepID=UPI00313CAE64